MAICLPCSLVWRKIFHRRCNNHDSNNDDDDDSSSSLDQPLLLPSLLSQQLREDSTWSVASYVAWWHKYDAVLFPTLFDLFASGLLSLGLMFVATSIYQMVRGTEVIFTAVLSVLILHRNLNKENIWGLVLCFCGLSLVGVAGYLNAAADVPPPPSFSSSSVSSSSAGQVVLGMLLIVVAESVQASQVVAEDFLMTAADTQLPPVEIVGYEGIFGMVLMTFVVLPLLQWSPFGREGQGLKEDSLEAVYMLTHSPVLFYTALGFVALMAGYNLAGVMVTDAMGALSRTVAETARTLLVWGINLGIYYNVHIKGEGVGTIGEPWTRFSWVQAAGFLVLVGGTGVYAHGEERHAKDMRELLQRRAREGWAAVRMGLPRLLAEAAREREGEGEGGGGAEVCVPVRPARIAGPARIRTALSLLQGSSSLRRRAAAAAAAAGEVDGGA